jgi:ribosomal subunit interface protein
MGAGVALGEVLPRRSRRAIIELTDKYFGHLSAATVYFERDGSSFRSTVNIQVGGLGVMTGEASHADCYRAFDIALAKVAKRLRRMKRRLRDQAGYRLRRTARPATDFAAAW